MQEGALKNFLHETTLEEGSLWLRLILARLC